MPLGPLEHCTYFSGLDTAAETDSGRTVHEILLLLHAGPDLLLSHSGRQVPVDAGHEAQVLNHDEFDPGGHDTAAVAAFFYNG